ncbi:S8 family serine peptidase [Bdellovibrio sp. HCB337]|uniref:S8 family serine peptidase n=1 Tax=Bdellovibrio sp. HCB337 TaxID=3394358 RepID=UPI0039A4CD6E
MKRVLFLGALLVSSQVLAGEYLVKYRSNNAFSTLSALSYNNQIQVLDNHTVGRLVKVDINDNNEAPILASLLSNPQIEYVVPNFKLHAFSAPMDPVALKNQWANAKVQAEKAWQRAGNRGSKNVLVAVIDTGVDYRHASLAANMVPGFDFAENDNDPMDKTGFQNPGHGTHCAGVIGATGVVEGGIIGISPEVSIMPLRFLTENGSGDLNNAIKAIDYAIANKVQVISASWGATVPRATAAPLLEAVKRADDAGLIFVSAAANDGKNNDVTEVYPANNGLPNSITVAASGPNDEKPSWSNYGLAKVHLASPGLNITSTLPGDKYGDLSGTSMATPLVSGIVALMKAQDPSLTGAQARAILQVTGAKAQIQTACNCRVDAFAAVDAVMNKQMVLVPAAATVGQAEVINFQVLHGTAPFKFVSANPSVASVTDAGVMTASSNGTTTITVTDASGKTATTLDINVGSKQSPPPSQPPSQPGQPPSQPPGQPPGSPGQPGQCPLGDPMICQIICQLQPQLPFCSQP